MLVKLWNYNSFYVVIKLSKTYIKPLGSVFIVADADIISEHMRCRAAKIELHKNLSPYKYLSGDTHHFFAARFSLCVNFRLSFRQSSSLLNYPYSTLLKKKSESFVQDHFGQNKLLSVIIYYDDDWISYVNMAQD